MNQQHHDMVIFDLDGTLIDTSPGIYGSVRYAESRMGLKPVDDSLLSQFVGPPPKETYMRLYGLSEEKALDAARFHREYGMEKAIYEAEVYEGIPETLSSIRDRGYSIAVSTLKGQIIADRMLRLYELYNFFDVIVGMDMKESLTKRDTIKIAMKHVGAVKAIMIGDSTYDYNGAKEAGTDFIGVTYGFGFSEVGLYPFQVIKKPSELLDIIV